MEGQTDVRNIALLTSSDEIIDWVYQIIQSDKDRFLADPAKYFTSADPRGLKLYRRQYERIQSDLKAIQNVPEVRDTKSVPVIDRVLRRLAGYMTASDIEFPVPGCDILTKTEHTSRPQWTS